MRRRTGQPSSPSPPAQGFHHHPFRQLSANLRRTRPSGTAEKPPAPPPPAATEGNDDALFRREMSDVRPLATSARARVAPPAPAAVPRAVTDPDAEALAELSDLVTGAGSFDLAGSVEFIEGVVAGLDRKLVRRLRDGDFAYQDHLDLHGMTAAQARAALDRFLSAAHRKGQRCVLIVHGRGRNSKDQIPVLKNRVTTWLTRGVWARLVLAFTSARACDGGVGALYVLLRRRPAMKRPIHVTRGAKL